MVAGGHGIRSHDLTTRSRGRAAGGEASLPVAGASVRRTGRARTCDAPAVSAPRPGSATMEGQGAVLGGDGDAVAGFELAVEEFEGERVEE